MNFILVTAIIVFKVRCDNWAYLLAGSNTWYNYRHQADAAHVNKILIRQGFDPDKIINVMYDDEARNPSNPYYNYMRNQPNGPNVYTNIRVDYSRKDVNVKIVNASMLGDIESLRYSGSGRFLDVTKEDTVFLYFTDHGAAGLFGLPNEELEAKDIVNALKRLKEKCKYVLVFVEACEAGSLFDNKITVNNSGILAVTAANSREFSYATYYDEEMNAYLGDEFSVHFLEYLDKINTSTHTLGEMVGTVKSQTKKSHVSVFGDARMLGLSLSTFFKSTPKLRMKMEISVNYHNNLNKMVPAHEVDRKIAKRILQKTPDHAEALETLKRHNQIKKFFEAMRKEFLVKRKIDAEKSFGISTSDKIENCYRNARLFYLEKVEKARRASISYHYLRYFNSLCSQSISYKEIRATMSSLILLFKIGA